MLILVGKAQLAGYLKVWVGRWSVGEGRRQSVTMVKLSFSHGYTRKYVMQI